MMLGSLALTGLKVTAPNMERTAQAYIEANRTMDLAVMSELGITQDDVKELQTIDNATVEPGYFKDVVLEEDHQAVRVFSKPEELSQYALVEGNFPTAENQIALFPSLQASYQIGYTFSIKEPDKNATVLKETAFTVVGFVASSEIWDNVTMGTASSGTGQLTGYGVVLPSVFQSDVYMIARISYDVIWQSFPMPVKPIRKSWRTIKSNWNRLLLIMMNSELQAFKQMDKREFQRESKKLPKPNRN